MLNGAPITPPFNRAVKSASFGEERFGGHPPNPGMFGPGGPPHGMDGFPAKSAWGHMDHLPRKLPPLEVGAIMSLPVTLQCY